MGLTRAVAKNISSASFLPSITQTSNRMVKGVNLTEQHSHDLHSKKAKYLTNCVGCGQLARRLLKCATCGVDCCLICIRQLEPNCEIATTH